MKKRNNEICLNTKYKNKVLYSKKFSLISVIILILCFTIILPGCGNNEPSKTVVGGDNYYNDDQNVDNNQDVNQNEYENEEEEENSYVGIWVSKPIYWLGAIYGEAIEIYSYDNNTIEFERRRYAPEKHGTLNWEEVKNSRIHDTVEIKKAHIGHGIPYFDLLKDPQNIYNFSVYIDGDSLYFEEYGKEENLLYPSDFTSLDTCVAFFNIAYEDYTDSFYNGFKLENNKSVSDYTEEDFLPDFDWKQITVDMIKGSTESIYNEIINSLKKDIKNFDESRIYGNRFLTFSAEKNFSSDIKNLNITVWLEYDGNNDRVTSTYIKATGTFDGITKIEYSGKDFKLTDSLLENLKTYEDITYREIHEYDNYRNDYIRVEDNSNCMEFKENGNMLDYVCRF